MARRMVVRLVALLTVALALAGCAGLFPAETPTPTPTIPPPTATGLPPTDIPTATAAPPSVTPAPPSATPQPGDPSAGAEGAGDPYFPTMGNGGYDVQHYLLDLDVDMIANQIDGVVTLEAIATQTLSRFNLDFYGFTIASILVNGEPAIFERNLAELTVIPAAPLAEGSLFTVVVAYSGRPGQAAPGAPEYSTGWTHYGEGVMVAGEPSGGYNWYPVNEHPSDKAAYDFRITVDDGYVVAANGLLVDTIDEGAQDTFVWQSDDPIASYLVTVAIGDFVVETARSESGVLVRDYYGASLPETARLSFVRTPQIIDFFESVFGPYPFDAYGVVVHPLNLGFALETQTLSVFGATFASESVAAHELAHQWFGDSVTPAAWQDIWLNEGFATYAQSLWTEHLYGYDALVNEMRNMYAGEVAIYRGDTFTLNPYELADVIARLGIGETSFPASAAGQALNILLGDVVAPEDLQVMIGGITADGSATGDEMVTAIRLGRFISVDLSLDRFKAFLQALGLGDVAEALDDRLPIGDPGPGNLFSRSVYNRGALTLQALRVRVGDEDFFAILQTYYARHSYSNASTADFIAVAEEISGQELDALFDAWLYQTLMPDIPEMGLYAEDF